MEEAPPAPALQSRLQQVLPSEMMVIFDYLDREGQHAVACTCWNLMEGFIWYRYKELSGRNGLTSSSSILPWQQLPFGGTQTASLWGGAYKPAASHLGASAIRAGLFGSQPVLGSTWLSAADALSIKCLEVFSSIGGDHQAWELAANWFKRVRSQLSKLQHMRLTCTQPGSTLLQPAMKAAISSSRGLKQLEVGWRGYLHNGGAGASQLFGELLGMPHITHLSLHGSSMGLGCQPGQGINVGHLRAVDAPFTSEDLWLLETLAESPNLQHLGMLSHVPAQPWRAAPYHMAGATSNLLGQMPKFQYVTSVTCVLWHGDVVFLPEKFPHARSGVLLISFTPGMQHFAPQDVLAPDAEQDSVLASVAQMPFTSVQIIGFIRNGGTSIVPAYFSSSLIATRLQGSSIQRLLLDAPSQWQSCCGFQQPPQVAMVTELIFGPAEKGFYWDANMFAAYPGLRSLALYNYRGTGISMEARLPAGTAQQLTRLEVSGSMLCALKGKLLMLPPLQDALPVLQVLTVSAVRVGYNGASRLPPNLKVIQVGYPLYPGALALVEAHCCLAGVPARTKVLACASLPPRGFPDEAWRDPSAASEDHPLYLADELYTTDFGFRGFAEVTSLVERQVQHVAGLEGVNEEQQVLVERTQSEWGQASRELAIAAGNDLRAGQAAEVALQQLLGHLHVERERRLQAEKAARDALAEEAAIAEAAAAARLAGARHAAGSSVWASPRAGIGGGGVAAAAGPGTSGLFGGSAAGGYGAGTNAFNYNAMTGAAAPVSSAVGAPHGMARPNRGGYQGRPGQLHLHQQRHSPSPQQQAEGYGAPGSLFAAAGRGYMGGMPGGVAVKGGACAPLDVEMVDAAAGKSSPAAGGGLAGYHPQVNQRNSWSQQQHPAVQQHNVLQLHDTSNLASHLAQRAASPGAAGGMPSTPPPGAGRNRGAARLKLASSSPEVPSDSGEEGWRPSSSLPPGSSAGALQPVGGTGLPGGDPDLEKGGFRRRRVARPAKSRAAADMLGDTAAGAEVPEQARHPGQQPLGSPGSTAAAAAAAASRASAAAPQANSEQGAAYGAAGMPGGATGRVAGALRTNSIPGGGPSSSAAASERATAGVGQSTGGMVGGVVSTQRGGSPCRQERVTTTSPQPRHQAAAAAAAAGAAKNRRDGTAGAAGAAAAASMMGRNGMVAQPGAGNAQQGQHRADAAGRAGMNPGTDGVRAAGGQGAARGQAAAAAPPADADAAADEAAQQKLGGLLERIEAGPPGDRVKLVKGFALPRHKKGQLSSCYLLTAGLLKRSGGVLRDLMVARWNAQQPQGSNRYFYDIPMPALKEQLQPALDGLVKVYQLHEGEHMAAVKVHWQEGGSRVVAALVAGPRLVLAKQGQKMQETVLTALNTIPDSQDNRAGSLLLVEPAKAVQAAYGQLLRAPRSALHMRQRSAVYHVYISSPCQEPGQFLHFLGLVAGCLGTLVAPDGLPGVPVAAGGKPYRDAAYRAMTAARRDVGLATPQQLVGLGYLLEQWQPPDQSEAEALWRLLQGLRDHEPISLGVERTAAAAGSLAAADLRWSGKGLDSRYT